MAGYRVYWLDRLHRIVARMEIEERSDADAIEAAQSVFERERDTAYAGFEIWERTRMVHREIR
ncbi:MAG TPA: hypothetical protein VLV50_10780 [Stellaceae bacterium]|nr:hypothetical protein [Stellaceae bacterium]